MIGSASLLKSSNKSNKLLQNITFLFYQCYFTCFKKLAMLEAKKLIINPKSDLIIKLYNLMETPSIVKLNLLTLPKIEYRRSFYIKGNDIKIDKNFLKEAVEASNSIDNVDDLNKFRSKFVFKSSENFNGYGITHDNEGNIQVLTIDSVKIKLLNHEYLDIPKLNLLKTNIFSAKQEKKLIYKNDIRDTIIIHIHGGGFISMSSDSHENYLRKWAKALKVPIFSIDYKLAPKYKYPEGLNDIWQAYNWLITNLEKLNLKANKVILTGDSAGGNLCILLTYLLILMNKRVPDAIFPIYPGNYLLN